MKQFLILLVVAGGMSLWPEKIRAERESSEIRCINSTGFLAGPDSVPARQYAPDREVQVLHVALEVTPDFKGRTIEATAVLRFKPVTLPVQEVKLDAIDLQVHTLTATRPVQAYQVTEDKIIVTFAEPIPAGEETALTIAYSAEPTGGLYFRTPEMGYKSGDTHLFTQGEAIEARKWYPCLDSPNQRLTSEITCHVPDGMVAVSNGRLVAQTRDAATGLTAFHWVQSKPHSPYLMSLTAGYFKKLEDRSGDIPLAFYTPASEIDQAASSFRDTRDMMDFFQKEIGVPYPWDKYDQVCVNDFVAGGMENTSATTLTDGTLFTDDTENIRTSEGLVAHELAHQWFGDLVTCKDWSHLWLNEGFATFYETLYAGHKHGREAMLYELYARARDITGNTGDTTPIVRRTYGNPDEMFGYLVYPKAGWVLHTLRSQLGESLYRQCIKTYLERHALGNVVTEDLRQVIEELSGRSYDQFFDQWFYHGRFPDLEVSYSWDEQTRLAKVSVQQTQEINEKVLFFKLPLGVRFKGKFGTVDRTVQITQKREDFYFPLTAPPRIVRVDPDYTLLAKISFDLPGEMLDAQLVDTEDMVGRLLAIEKLSARADKAGIAKLKERLNTDPFYGVRIEASKALRSIHTDEALAALLSSTNQTDARVRLRVVDDIGGFYDEKAFAAGLEVIGREKNPAIVSAALRDLAGYAKPEVQDAVRRFLKSDSYRNELAVAALNAARSQDDPDLGPVIMETLTNRAAAFTSHGFGQGLEALAYLNRNEEKKDAVREFLVIQLDTPRKPVQRSSIRSLALLGDPKAIAVLSKFATAAKTNPERSASEQAVTQLRAGRKPVDDFKNLRQEVLDLQKENRDLRKQLEALQKKVEGALKDSTAAAGSPKPGEPSAESAGKSKVKSPKATK
jgi:aminopeptidase N